MPESSVPVDFEIWTRVVSLWSLVLYPGACLLTDLLMWPHQTPNCGSANCDCALDRVRGVLYARNVVCVENEFCGLGCGGEVETENWSHDPGSHNSEAVVLDQWLERLCGGADVAGRGCFIVIIQQWVRCKVCFGWPARVSRNSQHQGTWNVSECGVVCAFSRAMFWWWCCVLGSVGERCGSGLYGQYFGLEMVWSS